MTSNEQRACVAQRTGIDRHIQYSKKEGARSPSVLAKAINAIIAAVYIDCGRDISVVLRVMQHLGLVVLSFLIVRTNKPLPSSLFNRAGQPVDPALLSLEHQNSPSVASLARSLFGIVDSQPSPTTSNSDQAFVECSPFPPNEIINPAQTEHVDSLKGVDYEGQLSLTQHYNVSQIKRRSVGSIRDVTQDNSILYAPFGIVYQGELSRYDVVDAVRATQTKKRNMHEINPILRKKFRNHNVRPSLDVLESYLVEESQKCERWGHPPPHETFLTPAIQEAVRDMSRKNTEIPAKILIYIASPGLIVSLQEIMETYRSQAGYGIPNTTTTISKMERLNLIVSLDRGITTSQLHRRYHILELYRDCGGAAASTNLIFMTTSADFVDHLRRPGNPANRSVACLTERMMQDIFPSLVSGTGEYRVKYRLMSNLRRLGHRLDMLELRFGKGILGLMIDRGTADPSIGITDAM